MAEIKIEKKNMAWLWILLVVGIAVLVYFVAFHKYNDKTTETPKTTGTEQTDLIGVQENNATVVAYLDFADTNKNKMTLDHAYTNEALLKLTNATQAIADEVGYEVKADLEKVKEYAEKITKDPFETTHADNIRWADDILTRVLQNIQMAKYPGLTSEVAALKNAAESIKPAVLTLDQRTEVAAFFHKAADLLRKMN